MKKALALLLILYGCGGNNNNYVNNMAPKEIREIYIAPNIEITYQFK